ncbi:hypothetical protein OG948_13465 [Embleya sp. NBC_00888]|uniref:hypothetical protein n=1 Tax=Embleya sp. NBC_00888 TaxID=2975960 RepID=UPI0038690630|nr:hypothetical protein OG948_13465 [Embleya sp. NBC_00888]
MGKSENVHLALWVRIAGLSHGELARQVANEARRTGEPQVAPDSTRVRRWLGGETPRPPVPALVASVLSKATGQAVTPGDLGFVSLAVSLNSIQLPLLTESAAATLLGWTEIDLMLNRREISQLAVGVPLVAAADRMLTGQPRQLTNATSGFDADGVAALETLCDTFRKLDAVRGGGMHRQAVVAQLAEVARRIQDGVPPSLRQRVFAVAADLAQLAGWMSHDCGRFGTSIYSS